MAKNLHDGHRNRMRERIAKEGISNLQEHEVLEYLLYCFVPRKDTNDLAHRLIERFGSFKGVLNADPKSLRSVAGMTDTASLFLSVLPEIFRTYVHSAVTEDKRRLSTVAEVRDYLGGLFAGLDEERVCAVALDVNDRFVAQRIWTSKNRAKVDVSTQQIAEFVTASKAISLIIAHNHPSGSIHPSVDDIELTKAIKTMLNIMDVKLRDHMIFNDKNEYYSFQQNDKL